MFAWVKRNAVLHKMENEKKNNYYVLKKEAPDPRSETAGAGRRSPQKKHAFVECLRCPMSSTAMITFSDVCFPIFYR